jgi:hypothetical protein
MGKASEKTSTWLALRNPIFRRLWLAMVVSGSCIGAHNTAVYWTLNSLGASTVLISLMATVSALGLAAHDAGVVPTFLVAAGFAFVIMIIVRVVAVDRLYEKPDFRAGAGYDPFSGP